MTTHLIPVAGYISATKWQQQRATQLEAQSRMPSDRYSPQINNTRPMVSFGMALRHDMVREAEDRLQNILNSQRKTS
jgi:hypothetical protein